MPHPRKARAGAARLPLLVALLLALPGGPLWALDGDSARVTLHSRPYAGNPHDVLVVSPIAYLGLDTGLQLLDISDPDNPWVLSHLPLDSPVYGVSLSGTLLHVANGESGYRIVDVSDVFAPRVIATLATAGTRALALRGNYAYLAESSTPPWSTFGVRIVRVDDPSNLRSMAFVSLPNGPNCVTSLGQNIYVGYGSRLSIPENGMAIINVANPSVPVPVGVLDLGKPVHSISVRSGVAYIAAGFPLTGEFVTASVTAPASPVVLGRYQLGDAAMDVEPLIGLAHVSARAMGMVTFDTSDDANPFPTTALPTGRDSWVAASLGLRAFLCERGSIGRGGLTLLDTPLPAGPYSEISSLAQGEATDAAAAPGLAYLLRRHALEVFDATDPGALAPVTSWTAPGADFSALDVKGPVAAIAEGSRVRLVAVGRSGGPGEWGAATLETGVAVRPVIEQGVLYVVNGRGFETFDIADPRDPQPLGSFSAAGWSSDIAVEKGVAYLTAGEELQIVDVSDPSNPSSIQGLSFGEHLFGVAQQGGLALVTGLSSYLYTVDVSSPSSPSLKGSLSGGTGFDVSISGDRALVAAGAEGLLVVNVSAASSPTLEGFYDTSGTANALANDGGTVYLASQEAQHWVFGCDTCLTSCSVDALVGTGTTTVCIGEEIELDGKGTTSDGCPGGKLLYQWYEDGAPIPGATEATYTVPDTHAAGDYLFWLEARCEQEETCFDWAWADVSIVDDSWPTIDPGSLRVSKTAVDHTLTWAIQSGTGDTNLHRSLDPSLLSLAGPDPGTVFDYTGTTTYTTNYNVPGEGVAFYRVFGRLACTGGSAIP